MDKVIVPTSWADISLRQFYTLQEIEASDYSDIEKVIHRIGCLCDLDPEQVRELPLEAYRQINDKLTFLNNLPQGIDYHEIMVDDKIYKFTMPSELTAGQFIDISSFQKDDPAKNIHNILAVVYLEDGEKYDGKKQKEKADLFLDCMGVDVAYAASAFFLGFFQALSPIMLDSLRSKMEELVQTVLESQ